MATTTTSTTTTRTKLDVSQPIQLVPIHSCTGAPLKDVDLPVQTLPNDTAILFLGSNDSTCILDPKLSHKVVKIYIKRHKLLAFCLPDGRGTVRVNGSSLHTGNRRELRLGDQVALESSEDGDDYIYKVHQGGSSLEEQQQATAPAAAATTTIHSTSTASTATTNNNIHKNVGEEAICAVCMEIMVEPQSIVPCGHNFCRTCLATLAGTCALCQGQIQSHVPCRSLQNLIEKLVDASEQQGVPIFEPDDVTSYRSRTGTTAIGSASSNHKKTTTNVAASNSRKRRWQASSAAPPLFPMGGGGDVLDLTD